MVTGRLIELNDKYYAILNLKHPDGRRLQKRFNLDMPVKNNRRRAEEQLSGLCCEYTRLQQIENNSPEMTLYDWAVKWLSQKEPGLSPTTYRNYKHIIDRHIASYFLDTKIKRIAYHDIEAYYSHLHSQELSSTTIQHHHMVLMQLFHQAYKKEIIISDPMPLVEKPKRQPSNISCYSVSEAKRLLDTIKGHKLEIPVTLTMIYGFRRSEVLGLRWSDIDFEEGRISVNHAVVDALVENKRVIIDKPHLKQKSSKRTLPLIDFISDMLKCEYAKKKSYNPMYVCTDRNGVLINPDEITHAFKKLLQQKGLRHIRFHDLRHSCASLLISARTPLVEVQHWLGHSTMLTTADLYCHLEYAAKIPCAEAMKKISSHWRNKLCQEQLVGMAM